MKRSTSANRRSTRRAFTLLEILLALALMIFLMGAISQALTMYIRLSTLGREEVEQAQIGRGVLQQIARDIRSITFTPAPEDDFGMDELGGEEVASEDDDGLEGVDPLDEEEVVPVVETGILGTSEELILYINRPDRRMAYVDRDVAASPKDRVSDALTVYYFLCRPNGSGVSSEFARSVAPSSLTREVLGLARMEGDRTTLNAAIDDNQIDQQVEATSLLAEEVISIQFRYFSGGEWLEEWDTMETNSLPQAIEIIVSVQIQDESVRVPQSQFATADDSTSSQEEERQIRQYRRVVGIPLVPPIEPEDL